MGPHGVKCRALSQHFRRNNLKRVFQADAARPRGERPSEPSRAEPRRERESARTTSAPGERRGEEPLAAPGRLKPRETTRLPSYPDLHPPTQARPPRDRKSPVRPPGSTPGVRLFLTNLPPGVGRGVGHVLTLPSNPSSLSRSSRPPHLCATSSSTSSGVVGAEPWGAAETSQRRSPRAPRCRGLRLPCPTPAQRDKKATMGPPRMEERAEHGGGAAGWGAPNGRMDQRRERGRRV